MTKSQRIRRIIASGVAVMMLAATLMSFDTSTTTGNAASLKHIDEIVAESGTFNILEIVPDTAAASFGYYIDGQEPISSADFDTYFDGSVQINGWKATLAQHTSPADRTAFINGLFGRLASNGVLGSGSTTPLQYTYSDGTSYYSEAYLVSDPQNWSTLHLKTAESITMTGAFSPQADGAYRAEYTYSLGSGYVQNISSFSYSEAPDGGDTYYYSPTFTLITAGTDLTDTPTMKWSTTVVYSELKDGAGVNIKDGSGRDIYVTGQYKTVKEILDNGGFDASVNYYYIAPGQTGAPGSFSSTSCYAAVVDMNDVDDAPGDGYTTPTLTGEPPAAGPSYFTRSISSYTYLGTGGNFSFAADAGGSPNTVHFTDIYYKAGFTNNSLFKQYVLGLADPTNNPDLVPDYNALNVTVTVRKASQVTAADISAAGMIYISAGTTLTTNGVTTGYTTEDIPDARAVDLYNYAAMQYPVIIDYPIIQGITEATPPSSINNIEKLCLLSLQSGLTPTTETSLSGLTVDWTSLAYMTADADKTFVNNSIYCFNAFNTVSTATVPNAGSPDLHDIFTLVSALCNEAYTSNVYTSGFSAVLAEIQNENFLKQIAGRTDLLPEYVTVSAAVRHIINFKGQRQSNPKTSIKVLDLEPAKVTSASSSYLTPAMVRGWINNTLPENKITIVHMTTGEFNGKIEDINETYDMVYIGMSTESLNTSSGSTVYNDTNMNGLIYSNIGDLYRASFELSGIRNQDYVFVNGTKAINGRSTSTANQFRFSGNDITETKVSDLKKFAQAGYPVILADGFISGSGVNEVINTAKVDNSSYMYTTVSGIYKIYPNVMKQSFAGNIMNADTVIKYLNVSKPALTITAEPVEYENDSNASIAVDPNDGYYYLKYEFSISNVTDATPVTTTYDCKTYIDLNADGRYSENERLDDIEVTRVSDGGLVLPMTDGEGAEYYALSADIAYQVTRQMPDSYVGIIPWKLEVIKNGADQIHASSQGYTRIAASATKTINVLQIMQPGTLDTKLNLAKQTTEKDAYGNYIGIYGRLIKDLKDFSVTISVITTDVLETKGQTSADILNWINTSSVNSKGADMLIIGFNDCYDGIQTKSGTAIVSYINSGKSVLFTHDTTSLSQVPTWNFPMAISGTSTLSTIPSNISDWGYIFNTVIRDAVGLDRYGVTSPILIDETKKLSELVNVTVPMQSGSIPIILEHDRSVAYTPKSAKGTTVNQYQGYTNYALIRFAASSGNTYKYTNNTYTNRETTNVSQVNKGQITTYPYNVNTLNFGGNDSSIIGYGSSYMKIGKTHEQYFQINMNTDDIVVWYCMSNGGTDNNSYYDDVPNDCVNAYYIYNKGNVTYSGVGHTSNASLYTGTVAQEYINEAKLFVNTMIAAYQSAAQAPKVTIKKDARGTSDMSEKYMLTDNASVLSMDLSATDESRAVYYRISDPNVGVSKTITVQYFVSDNAGGTIDPTIDANQKISPLGATETYNTNGLAVTTVKGGYVYKFFLADKAGTVEVLDQLKNENVYSIKIYIKVTTMIGSTPLTPAVDSIEVKKQQLFELS